jgi:hypothetical protein
MAIFVDSRSSRSRATSTGEALRVVIIPITAAMGDHQNPTAHTLELAANRSQRGE